MRRPNPTIVLLQWLTAAYGAGFVATEGALKGLQGVYASLARPVWSPPDWVFGPAWTVLYGLMAVAAWRVWRAEGKGLWLWWVQLLLGALWPWLFFAFGKLGLAAVESGLVAAAILGTILAFRRSDRLAPWLLVPSLFWVVFATALNFAVWRMNR